ncbi:unnamed protein product [Sphenostylis stenocarpa]|uniref:F-box domain-containing protein n=1 Tax=Sphenostylis stenocarpa TaxID=92480 RepID=A0AA86RXR9_9FABA|nr:unnamed protein product [Sphenostylis stenocarpa]
MEMSAFAGLHDDLQMEILSSLSVKALLRLRCVCRTWNSLIFHPSFVNSHFQRSSKNPEILIMFCINSSEFPEDTGVRITRCTIRSILENPSLVLDELRSCSGNLPLYDSSQHMLGVCNGLICMRYHLNIGQYDLYFVLFWNPATKIKSNISPFLHVNSCNDSEDYDVKKGFGYDNSNRTYKVVTIIFHVESKSWEVKVYCMGDSCWRRVLTCSSALPILQDENGVFVSGTLNWLALRTSVSSDPLIETITNNGNQSVIFSYDLKDEVYRYMSLPNGLSEVSHDKCYLGVLSGCLCLSHDHDGTYLVVWEMRTSEPQNSWTQMLKTENGDVLLLTNHGRAHFVLLGQEDDRVDCIESFKSEFDLYSTFISSHYAEKLSSSVQACTKDSKKRRVKGQVVRTVSQFDVVVTAAGIADNKKQLEWELWE